MGKQDVTDERKLVISGKVTDFDNNPLQNAEVEINNDRFVAIYKANTNDKGEYKISGKRQSYRTS